MVIPRWISFLVAAMVLAFGCYRLYIAVTSDDETLKRRKGLYGQSRRRHMLFGILYLILGGFIIAGAFGYNPFR